MADMAFNTIAEVQRLRDAGFEQKQAEAITLSIHSGVTGGVATKADLDLLKADLEVQGAQTRAEIAALDKKIEVQGAEIRTEIAEVRTEIAALDKKVEVQGTTVRTEIESLRTLIATGQANQLRWMIGLIVAATGAMIAALTLQ